MKVEHSELLFTESDEAAVGSATRQLKARYSKFCEYIDIQQECYIWLTQHYPKVVRWREEYNEKTAHRFLVKSLRNHGEKYCRKEKATIAGYEPSDEFFYSIPMVAELLQLYLDPADWHTPTSDLTYKPSHRPSSEGGNLVAMVSDVGKAFEAMPDWDKAKLRAVYGGRYPVREVIDYQAAISGISHGAMDRRIRRIVGRLRDKLGGPAPYAEVDG